MERWLLWAAVLAVVALVTQVVAARAAAAAALAQLAAARAPDAVNAASRATFHATEEWRQALVNTLYANATDAVWDSAARWKSYAQPDPSERSCAVGAAARPLLSDIAVLFHAVATLPPLADDSRVRYLALHTFHSTGLEGNTLTLQETVLTVAGQSLRAGFVERVKPTPLTERSTVEAQNLAQFWDAPDLASLSGRRQPPLELASLGLANLVDLNWAVTRGTGSLTGLRLRPVAIGHQRVLLSMSGCCCPCQMRCRPLCKSSSFG